MCTPTCQCLPVFLGVFCKSTLSDISWEISAKITNQLFEHSRHVSCSAPHWLPSVAIAFSSDESPAWNLQCCFPSALYARDEAGQTHVHTHMKRKEMEASVLVQKQMEKSSDLTTSVSVHNFTLIYTDTSATFTCVLLREDRDSWVNGQANKFDHKI